MFSIAGGIVLAVLILLLFPLLLRLFLVLAGGAVLYLALSYSDVALVVLGWLSPFALLLVAAYFADKKSAREVELLRSSGVFELLVGQLSYMACDLLTQYGTKTTVQEAILDSSLGSGFNINFHSWNYLASHQWFSIAVFSACGKKIAEFNSLNPNLVLCSWHHPFSKIKWQSVESVDLVLLRSELLNYCEKVSDERRNNKCLEEVLV
jgi:hypothetical protein